MKTKIIVHSAPDGDTLCGLSFNFRAHKTCYTPDQDVLENYMMWCGDCVKEWKKRKK